MKEIKIMKKYFLMLMLAFFAVSCSKKVEVKGKITNPGPLERVEIIEVSGVGTLPLINMGLNNQGEFSGSFEAPQSGMYVITYGGNMNMVYLKQGQTLNVSGTGADFPQTMVITGDAKANNDFLNDTRKSFETYAQKINVGELIAKDETKFLAEFQKIKTDVFNNIDTAAKKYKADNGAVTYNKNETLVRLAGLLDAYEQNHGQATGNASFKVSKNFESAKTEMLKNHDDMIKTLPIYRDYVLNKLNPEFQKFATAQNPGSNPMLADMFVNFLKTKKDMSQTTKDYLLGYVIAQSDINPMNAKNYDKVAKLVDENIKDASVKTSLKELQTVIMGQKVGTAPELNLTGGKATKLADLKGKPTLVTFYASWNPNISVMTIPVLKEVADFYKAKMNYAYVNLDDTKEQFQKTSTALLKGFPGENYWVEGGINSKAAQKFGLYGFKLPSYILLDKDGKIASRPFFNLGDPELITELEKLTGLKAPMVQAPAPQAQGAPEMAPQDSAAVTK